MKPQHLWAGLASITLAVVILFGVRLAQADTTPAPACPSAAEESYCIAVEDIHSSDSEIGASDLSTRYTITSETTKTLVIHQTFYDLTGTAVLTQIGNLSAQQDQLNYYVYDLPIPNTYTGTLVLTSTGQFTVVTVDPYTDNCPANGILSRCDYSVYMTAGATQYTIFNDYTTAISQTHDIYRDGAFVARQLHQIPGLEKVTFDVPTPSPGAAGRVESAEPPRYNVNVKPVRTTPTPEPTPKPDGRTNYVPLVAGQR